MENNLIFLLAVIALLLVFFTFSNYSFKSEIVSTTTTVPTTTTQLVSSTHIGDRAVSMKVPAVDNDGNGVVTLLKVEARDGEGRVLADVNSILFWVDTQYSIRTAQRVAQSDVSVNISNVDLIYNIETNASLIEGPSAGASLTVATIAALENKSLNPNVMMTGTINPDGTIGPVGGIAEKAKAAKDVGANLFLVPEGQGTQTSYKPVENCTKYGSMTYCTTEYKKENVDISKSVGIEVKEVATVEEALKYFLT
jgi:uncharacterized protein